MLLVLSREGSSPHPDYHSNLNRTYARIRDKGVRRTGDCRRRLLAKGPYRSSRL